MLFKSLISPTLTPSFSKYSSKISFNLLHHGTFKMAYCLYNIFFICISYFIAVLIKIFISNIQANQQIWGIKKN